MNNVIHFLTMLFVMVATAQTKQVIVSVLDETQFVADTFVGNDKFGFYYFLNDNELFKIKEGLSVEYKNVSLGRLTSVDLQNPLKILLFYENFNTVVTLDNQLNETQKINFSENPTSIVVSATGMASQNRLWIFDTLTQQLGLYDYLKNTYNFITPPFQGYFKYYRSDFNYFQWIDENNNWFSCDVFGKISNFGRVPDFDAIQITDEQMLLYSKDAQLWLQDLKGEKNMLLIILIIPLKVSFSKDKF